jgi:hypothetical protein
MREQSRDPDLTRAEADRRRAILGLLADDLAARRITSALAGRRRLVLCSAGGRRDGCGPAARPADPQLYVFGAGNMDVVTTDGESYRFASGRTHPAADPSGAAEALAVSGSA